MFCCLCCTLSFLLRFYRLSQELAEQRVQLDASREEMGKLQASLAASEVRFVVAERGEGGW